MKPSAPVTRTVRRPKTSPNSRRSAASVSSVQGEAWFGAFIVGGCPSGATESMPRSRKSAVRSGVVTGLSSLAVAGSAAGAGILLAHFFGRNERTDGLFVAYGVYLVLAIAAQAFRTVVLPQLTREAVTLGSETRAYLLALTGAGVVVVGAAVALAGPLGRALTAHAESAEVASQALPWLVAAGFLQLVAALAASALAARDGYGVAAVAYGLGAGKATSLNYAYLIAAVLVVATASSVALISSAPLTRRGIDVEEAVAHVVHSSWLSLALIAAAAGVFALAGGRVVGPILGGAYGGEVGRELGRLVAYLAPWMVVSVAFTLTYPLLFVLERSRGLVVIAVGGLAASVPIVLAGRELAGLAGIAGALAVSTALVLAALLVALSRGALWRTAAELGWGAPHGAPLA